MKDNLKRLLCNKLIKENLVQEGDCIRHSYSTNRLNKMYTQNTDNFIKDEEKWSDLD